MDIERIIATGFEGYVRSEIGGRKENQDSYGWAVTPVGLVVTVCDGMGGGPAGKTASSIAVEEIIKTMQNVPEQTASEDFVRQVVEKANLAVYEKAQSKQELMGMGSTCTLLVLKDDEAIAAYVGDSRIYQLRHGKKHYRTFDHSLVFELVKQKVITEEQARQSSQSNVITRALGLQDHVEVDVTTLHYRNGDRFMMSSDGIHGVIPEKELLTEVCDTKRSMDEIVKELTERIDEIGKEKGGGHDNLTMVLLEVVNEDEDEGFFTKLLRVFGLRQ